MRKKICLRKSNLKPRTSSLRMSVVSYASVLEIIIRLKFWPSTNISTSHKTSHKTVLIWPVLWLVEIFVEGRNFRCTVFPLDLHTKEVRLKKRYSNSFNLHPIFQFWKDVLVYYHKKRLELEKNQEKNQASILKKNPYIFYVQTLEKNLK